MKRPKIIIGICLGIAVAAGLGFFWLRGSRAGGLSLHGTVEIQEVRLSSKIGGRVKSVLVREGDLVQAGQKIVELEAPELEAQRLQLLARIDSAQAQLDKAVNGARTEEKQLAKAAMQSAEARWQKMKTGSRVEEIQQAQSELAIAKSDLVHAQETYNREKSLYPAASSKADYDAAVAGLSRAQGQVKNAQAKLQMYTEGFRVEDIAEAKAEWERTQANWELVEAGTRVEDIADAKAKVAELKARLQEVEANLREAVVIAPEKAIVEVLAVRPGDVVTANQPVARVLRADDLWVKAFVPEIEMGKVRLHQSVDVTCDSYPGIHFQGEVIQIATESEFTPRNVQSYDERRHQVFAIRIRVADPQGVFKSGMAAEVWLPLEAKQ